MKFSISRLKEKALELGFLAVGIGSAEPFPLYRRELRSRPEMYEWGRDLAERTSLRNLHLERFADPQEFLSEARSIIVVVDGYAETAFPPSLVGRIGRCYQKGLFSRIDTAAKRRRKEFRKFLQGQGLKVLYGPAPARLAGSRAGVTHFGKNAFAYANEVAGQSSWIVNEPYLVDQELSPDTSTFYLGCPEGCRICLEACPTGALYEPLRMDPRRCIAFHTYFNDGEIPRDLRPKMGTWVYGCDICQEVCPRNQKWLEEEKPPDPELFRRAEDWALARLLTMTQEYYESRVWPFLFYIRRENRKLWQRNAAVALGNEGSPDTIPLLHSALEDPEPLVRCHVAWALGRIGGAKARKALEAQLRKEGEKNVREEIRWALERM
jgi:epoxyqueuosine reductase